VVGREIVTVRGSRDQIRDEMTKHPPGGPFSAPQGSRGRILESAAKTTRSRRCSLGRGFVRLSTATRWRSTMFSARSSRITASGRRVPGAFGSIDE
jgi:hypothetical protein